ncbi:hypothetical protein PybrP1_003745 [[Pythium] brassicae (nom. inval.)]|nr:hypothetical protein PybrP1_003745 [[Pythium] brassicae (nom. inval.)]
MNAPVQSLFVSTTPRPTTPPPSTMPQHLPASVASRRLSVSVYAQAPSLHLSPAPPPKTPLQHTAGARVPASSLLVNPPPNTPPPTPPTTTPHKSWRPVCSGSIRSGWFITALTTPVTPISYARTVLSILHAASIQELLQINPPNLKNYASLDDESGDYNDNVHSLTLNELERRTLNGLRWLHDSNATAKDKMCVDAATTTSLLIASLRWPARWLNSLCWPWYPHDTGGDRAALVRPYHQLR